MVVYFGLITTINRRFLILLFFLHRLNFWVIKVCRDPKPTTWKLDCINFIIFTSRALPLSSSPEEWVKHTFRNPNYFGVYKRDITRMSTIINYWYILMFSHFYLCLYIWDYAYIFFYIKDHNRSVVY